MIRNIDNQLRVGVGKGLDFFVYKPNDVEWSEDRWATWPWLGIASDLGSDNVAAVFALERKYRTNTDLYGDPSHAANRDTWLALGSCNMKQFWILMMCSWNVPFAPDSTDGWLHMLKEALAELQSQLTPASCPLFLELAPALLAKTSALGIELAGVEDPEIELWRWLMDRGFCRKFGAKISACRFQASVHSAEQNTQEWHVDRFWRTFAALEMDMLKSHKLHERLAMHSGAAESVEEGGGQTSGRLTIEDRSLKAACQNVLVLSVVMLQEETNARLVNSILASALVVKGWHTQQVRMLRSVDGSEQWLVQQVVEGGYLKHCGDILGQLGNAYSLEKAGFLIDCISAKAVPACESIIENELAETYGSFCLALAACRLRRGLYYFGPPYSMFKVLSADASKREKALGDFKLDWQVFEALKGLPSGTAGHNLLVKRHLLAKISNLQLFFAFRSTGWVVTSSIRDLLFQRMRGTISTVACEEMIGCAKNARATKANRKFRKPETSALEHPCRGS